MKRKILCLIPAALLLLSSCTEQNTQETLKTQTAPDDTPAPALTSSELIVLDISDSESAHTTAAPLAEPVTLSFSGKPLTELFYDTQKRDACGGYSYEYPVCDGDITILGANLVYVGESFSYDCVFTTKSRVPVIEWSVDSDCGKTADDGTFTAVSAGVCTLTAKCLPDGISSSIRIHCIAPGDSVDFIPMINNIPIANKTYPLPHDYAPGVLPEAQEAIDAMIAGAGADGILLSPISVFRSYDYQKSVYAHWYAEYGGSDADLVSARPGFSEHQLGLAADFNMTKYSFADTKEGIWLKAHCAEYGFILRYPTFDSQKITGYNFEPWHVRFIGKDLSVRVTQTGLTLEELLGIDSRYR